MSSYETIRAVYKTVHFLDKEFSMKPAIPKKPSLWSRLVAAVGNAIGQAKFGQ
jgi:hypothetical protein